MGGGGSEMANNCLNASPVRPAGWPILLLRDCDIKL